jgi:DnaJ-class molecular chaperone
VTTAPSTLIRRLHPPRNERCEDCGGSGADSSGKSCGICNGLGEIYCRADHQGVRMLSRFSIRKEDHRWPTL